MMSYIICLKEMFAIDDFKNSEKDSEDEVEEEDGDGKLAVLNRQERSSNARSCGAGTS